METYLKNCLKSVKIQNLFIYFEHYTENNNKFSAIYSGNNINAFNIFHSEIVTQKISHTLELNLTLKGFNFNSSFIEQNCKIAKIPKYIYFLSKYKDSNELDNHDSKSPLFKIFVYISKDFDIFKEFNDSIIVKSCIMSESY